MANTLRRVGERAAGLNLRVVLHPDQFVVLSSGRRPVVDKSVAILQHHAWVLDLFGLPRSPWSAMTIHGGKRDRAAVRTRLTLENDERAYGAGEALAVCRDAAVPMVFDAHHHVCYAGLTTCEDPSVPNFLAAAPLSAV